MRTTILTCFILILISCSSKNFRRADLPDSTLIDSLVYCVIDSFDLTHEKGVNKTKWTYAVYGSLDYLKLTTSNDPDSANFMDNQLLLNFLNDERFFLNNRPVFSDLDSSFLLYQTSVKTNYSFDNKLSSKFRLINEYDIERETLYFNNHKDKIDLDSIFRWIKIFTPLVSLDKRHALIQINVNSVDHSFGFADLLILSRERQWKIIKTVRLFEK